MEPLTPIAASFRSFLYYCLYQVVYKYPNIVFLVSWLAFVRSWMHGRSFMDWRLHRPSAGEGWLLQYVIFAVYGSPLARSSRFLETFFKQAWGVVFGTLHLRAPCSSYSFDLTRKPPLFGAIHWTSRILYAAGDQTKQIDRCGKCHTRTYGDTVCRVGVAGLR